LSRFRLPTLLALAAMALATAFGCPARTTPEVPESIIFNSPVVGFGYSREELELRTMVARWAADTQRAVPELDPGLTVTCRRIARQLKEAGGESMSTFTNAVIQQELTRAGVSDAAIRTQMATVSGLGDLDRLLKDSIQKELGEGRYTHFGVGVARQLLPPGYFAMMIFSRRPIALDPFPTEAAVGDRIELSGILLGGLQNPRGYVARPSGVVREVLLDIGPTGAFRTHIFFDEGPGIYRVELSGESSFGPEIVALMPVKVGDVEREEVAEDYPIAASESEARMWVFAHVNQARKDAGAPPLEYDKSLESVAQSHAEEMRRLNYAAHRSPTTGMVTDRANAAGIKWRRIGENVALNQSALAAHVSLLESPAHRANVMDPEFTRIGIGVAFGDDGHGHRLVYLVENYMTPF